MKVDLNEYKTIVQNSLNNILKFLKMRYCLKITPEALDSPLIFDHINYIRFYFEVILWLLECI